MGDPPPGDSNVRLPPVVDGLVISRLARVGSILTGLSGRLPGFACDLPRQLEISFSIHFGHVSMSVPQADRRRLDPKSLVDFGRSGVPQLQRTPVRNGF